MPIIGLSDKRRLARDGKIKLGIKMKTQKGTEYPKQTDYFVVPDEVKAIYGEKPTELDIMFPTENMELAFPQYYKCYGSTGLKCKGDGQKAIMMLKGEMIERECIPGSDECRKAKCKPVATLKVLLPKVPGFGVWEFNTSSWNSIVNINTCIDTIKLVTGGRIAFIPLKLRYEPHTGVIYDPRKDSQFKKEVYVMSITITDTMEAFHEKFRIKSPDEFPELANAIEANRKIRAMLESKKKPIDIPLDGEEIESFEEFASEDEEEKLYLCADCSNQITEATTSTGYHTAEEISANSIAAFGRPLCIECGKKAYAYMKNGGEG